jgi:hypothetical protein
MVLVEFCNLFVISNLQRQNATRRGFEIDRTATMAHPISLSSTNRGFFQNSDCLLYSLTLVVSSAAGWEYPVMMAQFPHEDTSRL